MINSETRDLLMEYAARYENAEFLKGDPSWFMHQVQGVENQECMAFLASCLSYGSRAQFLPKIAFLLEKSEGQPYDWIKSSAFEKEFGKGDKRCFYRLYDNALMRVFFDVFRQMLLEYGSLGAFVEREASDGFSAVAAICRYFGERGVSPVIPKDAQSACKRVCMFLRWMVRSGSPVDLGLWADIIDRRTLIMPLDTHVLTQAYRLGLLRSKTSSMATARRLTEILSEVFPDDPLRGDFALFGYGVNNKNS